MEDYKIISSKFLGQKNGLYTYEITLNQSLVHIGRLEGMEDGLNAYRENEIKQREDEILKEADEINSSRQSELSENI